MNPQVITRSPHTFLPSGILIVEPHEGLLAARSSLLAAADYKRRASGLASTRVQQGGTNEYEVALAVLSESLGQAILSATAQTVREYWPNARILIFGRCSAAIEDNLYDVRIDHTAPPEDLLAALMLLLEDPWNQRVAPSRGVKNEGYQRLDRRSDPGGVVETDPTRANRQRGRRKV